MGLCKLKRWNLFLTPMNQFSYSLREDFLNGKSFQIDAAQYDKLEMALSIVVSTLNLEEVFQVFAQSFLEFEEELLKSSLEYAYDWPENEHSLKDFFKKIRRRLNVRIITILTAFRSYDDQASRILAHSPYLEQVLEINKQARKAAYDNNLSYRVCNDLRNYAQHRELPLGGFSLGGKSNLIRDEAGNLKKDGVGYGVSLWLNLAKLREASQTKSALRSELEEIDEEKMDINWLIRSFASSVYSRHQQLRTALKPLVEDAGLKISEAYAWASEEKGTDAKFLSLWKNDDKRPMRQDLPDLALRDLSSYSSLNNATHVYISSQINSGSDVYPSGEQT